ncbi:MAG TPA: LysM peptidoglycan-binding domain-containing protein [Gammaproteobacteria bacterium]
MPRVAATLAAATVLAGCQAFIARPVETPPPNALISPLADAVIGDPAAIVPPPLDVVPPRRPVPKIQLEPVPPPRPDNLLEQLRASFSLPGSDDPALERELEYFAKHPDYVERVLNRARPYLYYIAEQLEARDMPTDLALLPIVESAFDPFAYSHGRAAGLWQIIPGTARRFGVKQSWWFDGRRDIVESTRAALDYLESLHEMFDGDWLLAIAGYNSGEGNVARALARAKSAGRPADFWSIRSNLPRETRTYVPRLLAIRDLIAHAEEHGISLPEVPNAPYVAVVETGGQIDMALAAELAGLTIEELYQLNPGVNRWATDPDGPHHMLVPIEHAERFAAAIAELPVERRVSWSRHQIRQGETLIAIAQAYSTTPDVLRQVNGLRGNLIRAGDYLMIPHASASLADYSLSADARLASTLDRERGGERVVHRVQRGESLWSISRHYGVDVRALASWNGMAPGDTLAVGRELVVWVGGGTSPVTAAASVTAAGSPVTAAASLAAAASAAVAGPLGQAQTRRVNYTVRSGDSLYSIAQRFRVTIAQLLEWNSDVSASRYLHPGDRLVMYVNVLDQST